MVKYALDTNLYIRAIRDAAFGAEVESFYARHSPRIHLSSVVFHELLVGANSPVRAREVRAEIARPIEKKNRIVTPSHAAWDKAGEVLSLLAERHGMQRSSMPRAFVNDTLIAVSCAEAGVTLLTDNVGDFERLKPFVAFRFSRPWPPSITG